MKFAVAIGTYSLLNFIELNILTCRHVFGESTPIILSDGHCDQSPQVEALAEQYGCAYVGERINRGHFVGCAQNAVVAAAFAQHVGADIAVKINQRLILLSPEIPDIVSDVFKDGSIDIALPGSPKLESLMTSKFFAKFSYLVDVIFMRSSSFDPDWIKHSYESQWKNGSRHIDSYTEMYWANVCKSKCDGRTRKLDFLTNHGERPFKYLRKVQNSNEDYVQVARNMGMDGFPAFATAEWQQLRQGSYMPLPRA